VCGGTEACTAGSGCCVVATILQPEPPMDPPSLAPSVPARLTKVHHAQASHEAPLPPHEAPLPPSPPPQSPTARPGAGAGGAASGGAVGGSFEQASAAAHTDSLISNANGALPAHAEWRLSDEDLGRLTETEAMLKAPILGSKELSIRGDSSMRDDGTRPGAGADHSSEPVAGAREATGEGLVLVGLMLLLLLGLALMLTAGHHAGQATRRLLSNGPYSAAPRGPESGMPRAAATITEPVGLSPRYDKLTGGGAVVDVDESLETVAC